MTTRAQILITAQELAEQLERETLLPADAPRTRLLDVRWTLARPDGRADYAAGHIPGAVYVDLDTELSQHLGPRHGRHPLPEPLQLQDAARRWGVRKQDAVVVYDGWGNLASARAWWLLRFHGFDEVRLLDGALPAWQSAGSPLETGDVHPEPGDVVLERGGMPVLELAQVAPYVAAGGALLDARAPERYLGEEEPVDPRAGHIPGALNTPTGENLDADGRFRMSAELRQRFLDAGVRDGVPVASYCGSGVTAAHNLVALALAGFPGTLFPGSWSQWSNHDLPVARG